MKLCDTCIYRNNVEQLKPCIIYRDNCEYYEKERGDMTREEELDWLYRLRSEIYVYMPKEWLIPMNDALEMAIKALEQEPSGDLISKQAVIDTIHRFFTEEVDKIPTKETEDGEVYVIHKCQPLFEMNKALCKRIKALPSVTPTERTGHWIKTISENGITSAVRCSECGFEDNRYMLFKYCPNCGCRMVEPQESDNYNQFNQS